MINCAKGKCVVKRIFIAIMMVIFAFSAMCATPSPRNHKPMRRPAPTVKTVAAARQATKKTAKESLTDIEHRIDYLKLHIIFVERRLCTATDEHEYLSMKAEIELTKKHIKEEKAKLQKMRSR